MPIFHDIVSPAVAAKTAARTGATGAHRWSARGGAAV